MLEDLDPIRVQMSTRFMAELTKMYWDNFEEYESGTAMVKCQAETAVEMADALIKELTKA